MAKLSINDTCMATKKNKTNCTNKIIPGHLYCGTHIRSEGKVSLNEHVKIVTDKYNYETKANVVSLGDQWITSTPSPNEIQNENTKSKWPLEIMNLTSKIYSYILFFSEFTSYFGAGILIIRYISSDKKESYFMATHYAEINKYADNMNSSFYTKISLKSIVSLEGKAIFNKIKTFLNEYGIPYDINDINKRKSDISENNPVVMYNNINRIIESHYNTMYFKHDSYINSNINKD